MQILSRPSLDIGQALRARLYVSSDLVSFTVGADSGLAADMGQEDVDRFRVYRRLDLRWFGWLANKMDKARDLAESNAITAENYAVVCARWAVVVAAAVHRYGTAAIDRAAEAPPHAYYDPPKVRKGGELLSLTRPRSLPSPDPARATARDGARVLPRPAHRAA